MIVDSIPGMVARPDGQAAKSKSSNQQMLEYFGQTLEEMKRWEESDTIHPADLPQAIEVSRAAIASGDPHEIRGPSPTSGRCLSMVSDAGFRFGSAGRIARWYFLITDIDDRKKVEEALQSSERNLSLMINAIPTFIQVSRPDGTVLSVNQTVLDYHGVSLQDVQKEDFRSRFYHPDDAERLREVRKEALKRPLPFEYEQRALGKDGRYRWFLVRYNPLLDEQGRIDRWYAVAFDIEDRKRRRPN